MFKTSHSDESLGLVTATKGVRPATPISCPSHPETASLDAQTQPGHDGMRAGARYFKWETVSGVSGGYSSLPPGIFFEAAKRAPLEIRPLELYYGTSAYAKALVLATDRNRRSTIYSKRTEFRISRRITRASNNYP